MGSLGSTGMSRTSVDVCFPRAEEGLAILTDLKQERSGFSGPLSEMQVCVPRHMNLDKRESLSFGPVC